MKQEKPTLECSFCENLHTKRLQVAFLVKKLRLLHQNQHSRGSIANHAYNPKDGFRNMVSIVFSSHIFKGNRCCHTPLLVLLRSKVRCRSHLFNSLCQRVAIQLSERNYHLQLLATQIKNMSDRIVQDKVEVSQDNRTIQPRKEPAPCQKEVKQQDCELVSKPGFSVKQSSVGKSQMKTENPGQGAQLSSVGLPMTASSLMVSPSSFHDLNAIDNNMLYQVNYGYCHPYGSFVPQQ